VDAVRTAPDVEALARAASEAAAFGRALVDGRAPAVQVTRLLSGLSDEVGARAVALAVGAEDATALDFCWLAFGSEARREQTLATDQDNGIVFAAPEGAPVEALRERLSRVGRRVNETLAACGFRPCPGGVMGGNPGWCLSLDEWRERIGAWMDAPTPEAILLSTICLDFRPIWGDAGLAGAMRELVARRARGNARFLGLLAATACGRRPPLRLLGGLSVDGSGDEAGTVDLKGAAAAIFVDAGRVFALAAGAADSGTECRLQAAIRVAGVAASEVEGWIDAFRYVQSLRLRRQLDQLRAGQPAGNRVDPEALPPATRGFLLEALRHATSLQRHLERAFALEAPRI
jgi:CBS domain-containing protein